MEDDIADVTVIRPGTGDGKTVAGCSVDNIRAMTRALLSVIVTHGLDHGASPPEIMNAVFTVYLHLLCNLVDLEGARGAIQQMLDNLPDTYPVFHEEPPNAKLRLDEGIMTDIEQLPEHSKLGGSGAERWMNCPGSVTLINSLGELPEDDPDYRVAGVLAHKVAAHCLEHGQDCWELMGEAEFEGLDGDMASAVQTYLDYCRSFGGHMGVELRLHRPELHPLAFGTIDCRIFYVGKELLRIIDYKNGAGVLVEADDNPQLKYYAYLEIGEDREEYPDETRVVLAIVQPNGFHPDGAIREWETTAGAIREWANGPLKAAMLATETEHYLSMGEWCRFCPAKLVCPAMDNLAKKALAVKDHHIKADIIQSLPADVLGKWYHEVQALKMIVKVREEEVKRRMVFNGEKVPGLKLIYAKVNRVFKTNAPVEATFGADAYERKMVSPAKVEKMPGGADFVKEWAFKPIGALTITHEGDSRAEVAHQPTDEKFKEALALMGKEE